jgi:serine/threonine-protein phosphatase 2A regulatory subunit B'
LFRKTSHNENKISSKDSNKKVKNEFKAEFKSILVKAKVIYNYEDESKHLIEKREKLLALHRLLQLVLDSDRKFVDHVLKPYIDRIIEMIALNIFRPLPSKKASELDAMEGDNEALESMDKGWSTLEVVYEIFINVIKHNAISESILKHFLTESFIQSWLDLFESSNNEERDYMKRIIHKLYQKVVKRRKHFRKMFNNQFLTLIYERPSSKGANEILDIYSSVISGFAVPLRTEHVDFFKHFLTPLLKMQSCSEFYEELLRCILIFLNKDKTLAEPLLKTVLEFWPYGNTTKEIGFLVTLYESMDYITDLDNIELYIDPLFKRIASWLNSEHVQVIDRSMTFFEKDWLVDLIRYNAKEIYTIIVPPIERQILEHWHPALKSNFQDLRLILQELEADTYNDVCKVYKQTIEAKISKRNELDSKWKMLEEKIKENKPEYKTPVLPFKSDTLVSDFNQIYLSVGQKDQNISR